MEGNETYASGNWMVAAGSEGSFITRWTEFLEWTRSANPGFQTASLLQDAENPRHFISIAHWDDPKSRGAWKQRPEFAQRVGACRAMCDDFSGSDYSTVVQIG